MKRVLKVLGALIFVLVAIAGIYIAINKVPDRSVEDLKARWAQPPSQFVEVAGMQVHLRDEGPGDNAAQGDNAVPIVLLHGTGASLHTWDGWTEALRDKRRVIRFDLPAFGLTGPSPDNDYTIESYARFVIAVLDELEVNHCVLAGNSLGGYVAWATTVLYPDRVERLILVDASGYPFEAESMPIGFTIATTPVLNKIMEGVLPRGVVQSSVESVYGDPSRVTPELVDRYFELTTRAGNRAALVERMRQTQPGPLADRVPEIKVPTLILWGDKDRLVPQHVAERFDREIPNSKRVNFPELGHVPHEEDPEATVAAVKAFLAESAQ